MAYLKNFDFNPLIGQEVGTSVLLKKLDQGSMSVVFVAYQKTLKRQIAVKILPKVFLTPKISGLFQQEAQSAAFLSHPCIIPVYEVGETDDFLFFTMQLVRGASLSHYIRRSRKNVIPSKRMMPLKDALSIIVKVLDALDYANGLGIIHRDIKPGNILIEEHSHRPLITDFGVARSYEGSGEDARVMVGTPTYMAPEQILSGIVDSSADVYAAGVMLFEMLCGRLPYPPYDTALKLLKIKLRLQDRIFMRKPSEMNPAVKPFLDKIVMKAVSYNKHRRYATCREFSDDIEEYMARHLK
ncbi:MAG: serine/threonine-protein kinase [Desulfobacteraceae bacterium]